MSEVPLYIDPNLVTLASHYLSGLETPPLNPTHLQCDRGLSGLDATLSPTVDSSECPKRFPRPDLEAGAFDAPAVSFQGYLAHKKQRPPRTLH